MKKCRFIALLAAAIVCVAALGISASAFDIRDVRAPASASRIVYGYSGAGRELVAYKFGNGKNVIVTGFAIHGFEDNFDRDGGCLVYTADQLMKLLDQNRQIITDYGWTVYVLPCLNPDGLIDGYTNNGPGRCTTTYLDANGNLVRGTGIDLNRSFPTSWTHYSTTRNFNGDRPLCAKEAQALEQFVRQVKGKGRNICIDVHGWFTQIITSTGTKGTLFQTFKKHFPKNTFANCATAIGYFTAYTSAIGYESCLFEFPDGLYSMGAFLNSGYCEDFNACVLELLQICGSYNGHSEKCPSVGFADVIPWAWYHNAVDFAVSNQIFKGMSSTEFAPNMKMNRAMLVTTLYRMSPEATVQRDFPDPEEDPAEPIPGAPDDPPDEPPEEPVDPAGFTDVKDGVWYSDAVAWAAQSGIVTGFPDGSFRPTSPLTREQMAAIFYRYAQWSGQDVQTQQSLDGYPDASDVSKYAVEPMRWANGVGLIQGVASGGQTLLQPKGSATRAQAAAIIQRYLEGKSNPPATKSPEVPKGDPTVFDGPAAEGGN